ncbi:MAG: hypothetical protein AAF721_01205 [Myxococcota bacterium]
MTPARLIKPGMKFYVTVRTINRSFRLVPKRKIREVIRYCLAVKLQEYRDAGILVLHEFAFMSNHYHLLGTLKKDELPKFIGELNSLLARELNSLRGIGGKNFEPGYNLVEIGGEQRVIDHSVYTSANPVAAFLVAKARHWRGVSSVGMRYGVPVVVKKPKLGMWAGNFAHARRGSSRRSGRASYAGRSKLPATAELVIDRPEVMLHLSDDALRDEIEAQLESREEELAQERRRRGIRVLGRKRAEAVHYLSLPNTEEMFARTPNVSADTAEERAVLLRARAAFLKAYAIARDAFRSGRRDVVFPHGTWLMRVRFNVACEPAPAA